VRALRPVFFYLKFFIFKNVTAGKNKGFKIDLRFVKAVGCGVDANLTRFGYNPIDQAGVLPKV